MFTLPRLLPSLQASTSRLPIQAAQFSTSTVALKMKTHQGAAKRFKATAKGLVSFTCSPYVDHYLTKQFKRVSLALANVPEYTDKARDKLEKLT